LPQASVLGAHVERTRSQAPPSPVSQPAASLAPPALIPQTSASLSLPLHTGRAGALIGPAVAHLSVPEPASIAFLSSEPTHPPSRRRPFLEPTSSHGRPYRSPYLKPTPSVALCSPSRDLSASPTGTAVSHFEPLRSQSPLSLTAFPTAHTRSQAGGLTTHPIHSFKLKTLPSHFLSPPHASFRGGELATPFFQFARCRRCRCPNPGGLFFSSRTRCHRLFPPLSGLPRSLSPPARRKLSINTIMPSLTPSQATRQCPSSQASTSLGLLLCPPCPSL